MAGPIAIDTPDYQRGIVSAQKVVLTTELRGTSVPFGVPPNAESLIVFMSATTLTEPLPLVGVATGQAYQGQKIATGAANLSGVWIYDAAPALDPVMRIGGGSAIDPITVTIYSDSAAHIVADASKLTSLVGQEYVIPSVPSTLKADHPPNELQWGTTGVSNGQNVQGGLLASQRYRVFTAQVANFSAAAECELLDSTGNWFFQASSINPAIFGAWPLTGIPLAAGSPIVARVTGGASCSVSLGFTIEVV